MRTKPPSRAEIEQAARLLRDGKLVAFPTETVYGLGANALDEAAVARIFEAKGRPTTSPVIVHVSSVEMARSVVAEWPESAERLAQLFWPGPLTLVLPKRAIVPTLLTAGLDTVGVRMPAHPIALALIEAARVPVAAPSANRFSQISPTTAQHVREGLGNRVDYILDGGPCTVGIESTVLSLASPNPVLLRPGGVSRAQLESVLGPVALQREVSGEAHPSPGMHPRHYSPRTRLVLVTDGNVPRDGNGAYLQLRHSPVNAVAEVVQMPGDAEAYAVQLYSTLHRLDAHAHDWLAVDEPPDTPAWEAVRDRLRRAAG
jgi:L-threonylcarbamoyladenylate synthase